MHRALLGNTRWQQRSFSSSLMLMAAHGQHLTAVEGFELRKSEDSRCEITPVGTFCYPAVLWWHCSKLAKPVSSVCLQESAAVKRAEKASLQVARDTATYGPQGARRGIKKFKCLYDQLHKKVLKGRGWEEITRHLWTRPRRVANTNFSCKFSPKDLQSQIFAS